MHNIKIFLNPTQSDFLVFLQPTLLKKQSKCPRYNMKCRGKPDTTGKFPRSIKFSPLHFILYRRMSITFGTVQICQFYATFLHCILIFCLFQEIDLSNYFFSQIFNSADIFFLQQVLSLGPVGLSDISISLFSILIMYLGVFKI